ncbi:hypothetical protein [Clostridium sp. YIM B02506]|uniref:hypothetical protein n=1 Tax=Clostridium sp. YIM B02506 TaxID=2910680 RepID=UPI001EEE75F1|nr:hypothetical protein [Clostridium sp. YIM B02506]
MKISISQVLSLKTFSNGSITMRKEFESNIIPHKGDMIGDPVFSSPYEYEVADVIIDYENNTCYVTLEMVNMDHNNVEVLKEWKEVCKLHGWEASGYLK